MDPKNTTERCHPIIFTPSKIRYIKETSTMKSNYLSRRDLFTSRCSINRKKITRSSVLTQQLIEQSLVFWIVKPLTCLSREAVPEVEGFVLKVF